MTQDWFSDTPISQPILKPNEELISFNGFSFSQMNGIVVGSVGVTNKVSQSNETYFEPEQEVDDGG